MNQLVRTLVLSRARGLCEACTAPFGGGFESATIDHFFGRAKADEDLVTCWALCVRCHDAKTNNRPNAAHWQLGFARHCARYFAQASLLDDYLPSLERALTKLSVLKAKGFA